MKRATVTVVCAIGGWIAPVSADAPKVSLVSSSWQLGFIFHDPQRISLVLPADDRPTMFWYMLYQVNNGTPQEDHGKRPILELLLLLIIHSHVHSSTSFSLFFFFSLSPWNASVTASANFLIFFFSPLLITSPPKPGPNLFRLIVSQ